MPSTLPFSSLSSFSIPPSLTCDPGNGAADVPIELVHLLPPDADRVGVEQLLRGKREREREFETSERNGSMVFDRWVSHSFFFFLRTISIITIFP